MKKEIVGTDSNLSSAPTNKISSHPSLPLSPKGFILLLLLPLLFYTFSLLRFMLATVPYPWELDQGEGHNVWSAWLLMQGRGPYLDLNHYPFFDINYPPLHFVLMIPFLWVFGPSLAAGRLLSDLGLFALAWAVGAIVWRYTRRRTATALSVLLILANPYLYIFGIIASVNVSQVMLGAWGLYFLGRALDQIEPDGTVTPAPKINRPALLIGLAFLLAALYTKQQALDTVAAGFLFLLWRRPKLAVVCGAAFLAIGGGLFLLIDRLTAHQFYINLVKVNLNDFLPRQLREQWQAYALTHAPLLLLAAAYTLTTLRTKNRLSLWLLYLLTTTLGSIAVGKFGASETYFYSSITAVAITAGLITAKVINLASSQKLLVAAGRLYPKGYVPAQADDHNESPLPNGEEIAFQSENSPTSHPKSLSPHPSSFIPHPSSLLLALLLLAQIVLFYHTPETPHPWKDFIKGHSGNYVLFGQLPTEADRAAGQRLADLIKAAHPPVLTEEASFAMVNGYEVVTNPSNILVYNQAGLWQGQELNRMIQERRFSLILLHGHFLPGFIQEQIQINYRQAEVVRLNGGEYVVWERLK